MRFSSEKKILFCGPLQLRLQSTLEEVAYWPLCNGKPVEKLT